MRRSSVKRLAAALLAGSLLLFALAGCDFLMGGDRTATVTGRVLDVTTGNGVAGVRVEVAGHSATYTLTNTDGYFTLETPTGSITLHLSLTGYQFNDVHVSLDSGEDYEVPTGETIANPPLSTGMLRMVLTWGLNPDDLDSHLYTPEGVEVYYANEAPAGAGAYLDVDDTTSYGPETITIMTPKTGTYEYFIHRYAGSGTLTTSGAQVRVYDASGLLRIYSVPTSGTGDYWRVFTLDGTTLAITDVNAIVTTSPVS